MMMEVYLMRLQRVSVAKDTPERAEPAPQQPGEGLAELGVEGGVDQRVDGGGGVAQPQRHVACNRQQSGSSSIRRIAGRETNQKQAGERALHSLTPVLRRAKVQFLLSVICYIRTFPFTQKHFEYI